MNQPDGDGEFYWTGSMKEANIQHFIDESTSTLRYIISDPATGDAAIIDPVFGYSAHSGQTDTGPADKVIDYADSYGLNVTWILKTHAHANHLTAADYIKSKLGDGIAIGEGIRKVQAHFAPIFNRADAVWADGSDFDHLLTDREVFNIGNLNCEMIAIPGHPNDSVSYRIGTAVFVGDSLFKPDSGTARCDFPGGDAGALYESIRELLSLPGDTRLNMCQDYRTDRRELRWASTVDEQRKSNVQAADDISMPNSPGCAPKPTLRWTWRY